MTLAPMLLAAVLAADAAPPAPAKAAAGADPAFVAPPDSLVSEGLPPISAALASAVRPYTEFRGAVFLSWHPLRREMLIATRFADTVQVHRVVAARGARTQLTFFPDRVPQAAFPRAFAAPVGQAGELIVFGKDTGGNEFAQNYRLDLPKGGRRSC